MRGGLTGFLWTLKRELYAYFFSSMAYIFLTIFLVLLNILTFGDELGNLYGRGTTDLQLPFFIWHPWLFMLFMPAIGMRMWAEERRQGTWELLATMPVPTQSLVLGKYAAGAVFIAITLGLTTPVWITVTWLGEPDHAQILCGYVGSFLMALTFLAIASFFSALTSRQILAFIMAFMVSFLIVLAGFPPIVNLLRSSLPEIVVQNLSRLGVYSHVKNFQRGIVDIRDILYFLLLNAYFLISTRYILDEGRS
ncbi:MAG: ABC transporter permease [Lentisphaerae bacterium]|nr:MAG: ABC transporter permease [Lentisphaerota bacterium]